MCFCFFYFILFCFCFCFCLKGEMERKSCRASHQWVCVCERLSLPCHASSSTLLLLLPLYSHGIVYVNRDRKSSAYKYPWMFCRLRAQTVLHLGEERARVRLLALPDIRSSQPGEQRRRRGDAQIDRLMDRLIASQGPLPRLALLIFFFI